ncbi:EamA family transporter [Nocardia otitidiscaviarum]|uniref:EamA family transporter n=1 Tax=Nocardia otitidiscaviarum TaxID=1823 RepID=A0A516NIF6_9NOCA|nr:EamA family transporter [Nocardia otitidiscaviarum]MCP9619002.1 EamA family transporter [Nocardia otitidiscaviarum]QDP78686.1 EamA family transporter [Nocardia otitidiscaviarum]
MPNHSAVTAARRTAVQPRSSRVGGALAILTAATLWGTTGTVATQAPSGTPAAATGSAGLLLGGLLLYLTARGVPARTRRERWQLALGAVAVAGYPLTFYPAVQRTGVAVATVIALGCAPVFAGVLAWATTRTRPDTRWMLATPAAVTGCAVLVLGSTTGGGVVDPLGVLLAAGGGLAYACYALIGGRLIAAGRPAGAVMGAMFGGGALLVLPVVLATGPAWLLAPRGTAVAMYLALCTTVLAYRLFGYGLRHTTSQTATTLTLVEPAVAALLGVVVLHERLSVLSRCGMAVLVLALVILAAPTRGSNRAVTRRR